LAQTGPVSGDDEQAADVLPGNVYYYFKTRDEIVAAVIQLHIE
jgi:AcrR family transcriptional regulator